MKAKIDISKIPEFESFPDEVKQVISNTEIDVPGIDQSKYVLKEVFDRKASEASSLSKQLKSKMSEAEQAEADKAKLMSEMQAELETLKKEKTVSGYKAQYLALGYDENLASETALAMAEGKMETVFQNQKLFQEAREKSYKAAALDNQPNLSSGEPIGQKAKEKQELNQARKNLGLPPV